MTVLGVAAIWWWRERGESGAPAAAFEPDAGLRMLGESEPNDSREHAQALDALPVELSGVLRPGDEDVYEVRVPPRSVELLFAHVEDLPGARLRVVRAKDAEQRADVVAPARVAGLGVSSETSYYLHLTGAEGAGNYRLLVSARPWSPALEFEPDDDTEHAQDLLKRTAAPNELARYEVTGWWSRPGDIDCFVVPLLVPPSGAVLRFELAPAAGTVGRLQVLDSGDAAHDVAPHVLARMEGAGPGEAVVIPALGGRSWESHYFACIEAAAGQNHAEGYRLAVRSWSPPGPFEFEPNDSPVDATALPDDTWIEAHLHAGDTDWYRLSASSDRQLSIVTRLPEGMRAAVAVLDDERREIVTARVAGEGHVDTDDPRAALVRITVEASGSTTSYRVVARGWRRDAGLP